MRAEITPHTLQEIAAEYVTATSWLASIGFPVERGRLREYQRVITNLSADFPTHGWGDLSDFSRRHLVCTALLEIRELISIYRGLSRLEGRDSTKNITHYLKGPFSPKDELPHTSSNRPRNVGFELYLNALFTYAGFRPMYSGDADLSFVAHDQTFFVEAKRPTSAKAADGLIYDANRQLTQRLTEFHNCRAKGVIALDLTKVVNPDNRVIQVFGDDHLHALMYNEDKRQIEALSAHWHRKRHKRVVGVLLHYKLLINLLPTGTLNTLKWIGSVKLSEDPSFDQIGEALENVIHIVC